MITNTFEEYIAAYIETLEKVNDRPKAQFFIDYLKRYFGDSLEEGLDSPVIFSIIDKDFLIENIRQYIKENYPAKSVAESYRRTVLELCDRVSQDFPIDNHFLDSHSERNDFIQITDNLLGNLKPPETRIAISPQEYKELQKEFQHFLSDEALIAKIEASLASNRARNDYGRFVSAIAFKLIDTFGLDNKTIANLKISAMDLGAEILHVNSFDLPLDHDLVSNLKTYLKFRSSILEKKKIDSDMLFIKRQGTPYLDTNGYPDNSRLFLRATATDSSFNVTGLQYRTIIKMVSKNANINLLSALTNVPERTIASIVSYDSIDKESFVGIMKGNLPFPSASEKNHASGLMRCPYCGNYKDASAENWILVQVVGQETKHIACRECKGFDGKYRY